MKKNNFIVMLLATTSLLNNVRSQDILVFKNGEEAKSKVLEINDTEIKYKKFDNLDGPVISTKKTEVFMIKYENGTKDVINSTSPTVSNSNPSGNEAKSKNKEIDRSTRFGIYANPLGFVQFGPIAGMELTIASRVVLDAHARFSSVGLLMYVVTESKDGGTPYKVSGMGLGGGLKYMIPSRIGGLYLGMYIENGWQTQYYDENEPWIWQEDVKYFVTAANIGYKFKFSSGFFLKTGAIFGTANVFEDKWYYTRNYNGDSSIHDAGSEVQPFGMLELGLGIEF